MRLRCRKCMKINDFKGQAGDVGNCAHCGADMMKQFSSFSEMQRAEMDVMEFSPKKGG